MKLSLFTPTHNTKYLHEAWHSLQFQGYENYEWVIAPTYDAKVPPDIASDPRVRVLPSYNTDRIGEIKRYACDHCNGDVFVEFDHDDMLAPGILSKVAKRVAAGAGFVYSDVALFHTKNYAPASYSAEFGWGPYGCQIYERPMVGSKAFEPSPRSLCEIYYAPDHIRCWTRDAYYHAGGHDPQLSIGEDHDLIVRTYLQGSEFTRIPEVGYLYRLHEGNSVKARQKQIAKTVASIRRKNLVALAQEWCRRHNYMEVDVAEMWKQGNWHPVESTKNLAIEKQSDMKPVENIGLLHLNGVLEFIPRECQVPFWNWLYRCLVPGGVVTGCVPDSGSRAGIQDPRYLTQFNINSLQFYCKRRLAETNPEITCRFQAVQLFQMHKNKFDKDNDIRHIQFDLCALKGQRQPGRQFI